MRRIWLRNKRKYALVSDRDYRVLAGFTWYMTDKGYAAREEYKQGCHSRVLMHRQILQAPKGVEVDHKNMRRLDNRRMNLRLATRAQQTWNQPKRVTNTSGFKGVTLNPRRRHLSSPWQAKIFYCGRTKFIGYFSTARAAGIAYRRAAKKIHRRFFRC